MKGDTIKKIITYLILILIVLFNAYLYRSELKILSDVNDNIFQYGLLNEAKNIWKQVLTGKLSIFYLFDSHNERWNEGFALSTYYAHLPQAVIGVFGVIRGFPLYDFFNLVKYLFLVFLPVSFFLSGKILGFSPFFSVILALFSQLTFTNGLYGIDAPSYLWRGWGLSAQLMAVFFLPLAFAYSYTYISEKKNLGKAVLFNFLLASCHFGLFYMLALSYGVIGLISLIRPIGRLGGLGRLGILGGVIFFSLAYFIIPFYYFDNYRNFSVWDPLWKFNSFGINQALTWFLNGELFDFNRFPLITILVLFGVLEGLGELVPLRSSSFAGQVPLRSSSFAGLGKSEKSERPAIGSVVGVFGILFIFYFILFFGREGLGKIVDLIPGLSEFHIHRFIVMVQFTGMFLASWLVYRLSKKVSFLIRPSSKWDERGRIGLIGLIGLIGVVIVVKAEQPIIKYARENELWLVQSNERYRKDLPYYSELVKTLERLPKARIYVGRPGNWGREFKLGDTTLYMALSADGFPVVGFAPESWSPNSEFDQFFNEYDQDSYNLFNVRYLLVSSDFKLPDFVKLIEKFGKYNLYEVKTDGWFSFGKSSYKVCGKKSNFVDIIKFWQVGQGKKNKDYPKICFSNDQKNYSENNLRLIDKTRLEDETGKISTLWESNLFSQSTFVPNISGQRGEPEVVLPAGYKTSFKLSQNCQDCILVLKQTYHPNWQVVLNGKKVNSFPVFPFYIGIPIEKAGSYKITAIYEPNKIKILLIWLEIIVLVIIVRMRLKKARYQIF